MTSTDSGGGFQVARAFQAEISRRRPRRSSRGEWLLAPIVICSCQRLRPALPARTALRDQELFVLLLRPSTRRNAKALKALDKS